MSKKVGLPGAWLPLWRESTYITPRQGLNVHQRARSVARMQHRRQGVCRGAGSAECGCRVVERMAAAKRRTGARLYGSARSGPEPRPPRAEGRGGGLRRRP